MQALKTDNQWVVRKNAAIALAKLQARDAVPLLMEVVGSDENVFVREAAAEALGRLGDKRAVTALKEALNDIGVVMTQKDGKTVEEKSVVKAAEKALAQLGADTEADPKAGQKQEELAQAKPDKDRADVTSQEASPAMPAKVKTAMADEEIDRLKARIQACTKALKIQPEDALAYHHRGLANFKLGNHDQAVQDLTKALDLNPGDATIYYNRAVVHADLGRYEEAIEDGTKSIKLDPDFADAYLNRGIDYLASGRIKEALADFEKLTELKTQDASGYYGRGIAKLKLGSHNPAIKDFKTAADMGNEKAKRYLKAVETSRSQS
jgi:tetratricopeptide (TPR) repeat protein